MIHSLGVIVVHRPGLVGMTLLPSGLLVPLMPGLQWTLPDEVVPIIAIGTARHRLGLFHNRKPIPAQYRVPGIPIS